MVVSQPPAASHLICSDGRPCRAQSSLRLLSQAYASISHYNFHINQNFAVRSFHRTNKRS